MTALWQAFFSTKWFRTVHNGDEQDHPVAVKVLIYVRTVNNTLCHKQAITKRHVHPFAMRSTGKWLKAWPMDDGAPLMPMMQERTEEGEGKMATSTRPWLSCMNASPPPPPPTLQTAGQQQCACMQLWPPL